MYSSLDNGVGSRRSRNAGGIVECLTADGRLLSDLVPNVESWTAPSS